MNKDEILDMKAGREMDALIAEKVMGWRYNALGDAWVRPSESWRGCDQFRPSVDITAALEVAEKFEAFQFGKSALSGMYYAHLNYMATEAESIPLAICRAALSYQEHSLFSRWAVVNKSYLRRLTHQYRHQLRHFAKRRVAGIERI